MEDARPAARVVQVPGQHPGAEMWMQSGQDERELKRQRRKQSNRESARRSRLRKQVKLFPACGVDCLFNQQSAEWFVRSERFSEGEHNCICRWYCISYMCNPPFNDVSFDMFGNDMYSRAHFSASRGFSDVRERTL